MAGQESGGADRKNFGLQDVVNYFEGLLEKQGKTTRRESYTILEYITKENPEIRKFICGFRGLMWELWLHLDGEITPPILEKNQIPYIACVYFKWLKGGRSKGKQTTLIPSEHLDRKHGLLYWCILYIEDHMDRAKYYEDGAFNAGGYLWFPTPEDLEGGRKLFSEPEDHI